MRSSGQANQAGGDGDRPCGIRVLLVDDHAIVRQALRTLLEAEADVQVIGEAANGRHAVELVRTIIPDIVLMDVRMPEMDGIEASRIIGAEHPGVCIIGLSMFEHDRHGEAMREAGARAYVSKSVEPSELLRIVRSCAASL